MTRSEPAVEPVPPGSRRVPLSPVVVAAVLTTVTMVLVVDALVRRRGEFDYELIRSVRRIDFAGFEPMMRGVSELTGSELAIGLWAALLTLFLITRRWLASVAMIAFPVAGGVNWATRSVVSRARPDPQEIGGSLALEFPHNDFQSFPSGHVVGAVLLYGFLFLLAGTIQMPAVRWGARMLCVGVIASAGVSRVWLGDHWVGDVVAAYAFGGLVLTGVVVAYRSMAPTCLGVPLVRAAPVPHADSQPHAHALTSTILFRDGRVLKIYNPGFVPRLAYWLAFQAPFGYAHNRASLQAAAHRRNLAAMLTQYWYGTPRVAHAYGPTMVDGRLALEGHYTDGEEPADHHAARAFLFDLAARFDSAGLPTWQIDPRQPRSLGNLLETAPGTYTVIDLESGLVSPLQSPRAWWRGIRRSTVPLYDDVFFDVTRDYVAREADSMRERLGDAWYDQLDATLEAAESTAAQWHGAEPRIWSRLLRLVWSGFGIPAFPGWIRGRAAAGRERADAWVTAEIDRWEAEGRYTAAEARHARSVLEDRGVQEVLPHFGVHLIIAVALRFPFGSIARVAYVTANLLLANVRFMFRRIDRREWRRAVGIHSPLVILIAAMPGIGTFSYLAAWPMLANRAILRVALDAVGERLPWSIYRRTGLRRLIARPARASAEEPL